MSTPKINSLLDEGNRLFLQKKFQQAITYYDKILDEDPKNISSLNNKGYASVSYTHLTLPTIYSV